MTVRQQATALVNKILAHGVDGTRLWMGSQRLADAYADDPSYHDSHERSLALIRWEAARSFGTGFATGLGGAITLPVAIPASLYTSYVTQARMTGAVAELHGYSTKDPRVRTAILLTVVGDPAREALKRAGVQLANKVAMNAVEKIPGRLLVEINQAIGVRLITKAGTRGIVNLVELVPLFGGLAGGTVDGSATMAVGRAAVRTFGEGR